MSFILNAAGGTSDLMNIFKQNITQSYANKIINSVVGWQPIRVVTSMAASVAYFAIINPMAQLYLRGPTVFGMWGGQDLSDICAQLTGSNSRNYLTDDGSVSQHCIELIENRFYSWVILFQTIVYIYIMLTILRCVLQTTKHYVIPQVEKKNTSVTHLERIWIPSTESASQGDSTTDSDSLATPTSPMNSETLPSTGKYCPSTFRAILSQYRQALSGVKKRHRRHRKTLM